MNLIKKALVGFTSMVLAVMPLATQAAADVKIESTVNVANVTGGVTPAYSESTSAKIDDVVRVSVWYHNREDANSGKVANDLKVKLSVPTKVQGKVQKVTSTVGASNSNTITDTATINLSVDRAYLEYIPGSGNWRHNTGSNSAPNWVNTKLTSAQEAALFGSGVVLENAKPCFNFEATLTAEFRVRADIISIVKQVRVADKGSYVVENSAEPGDTLDYVLIIKNEGNTVLDEVQAGDNLPPYMTYVPGSTRIINSVTGKAGKALKDGVTSGGITIDDMSPGAVQYVYFKVKLANDIPVGNRKLKNVGITRAKTTNQIFNVAYTNVNVVKPGEVCTVDCQPETPDQPGTLPQTGIGGAAAAATGSGALGYAVRGYIRSRRALVDALRRK